MIPQGLSVSTRFFSVCFHSLLLCATARALPASILAQQRQEPRQHDGQRLPPYIQLPPQSQINNIMIHQK
jgi:hypothetical protein